MHEELLAYLMKENGLSVISDLRFVDRSILKAEMIQLRQEDNSHAWSETEWNDARQYLHITYMK